MDFKPSIQSNNPDKPFMGIIITHLLEKIMNAIDAGDDDKYICLVDHLSRTLEGFKTREFNDMWPPIAGGFSKRFAEMPRKPNGSVDENQKALLLREMADAKYSCLMQVIRDSSGELHMADEIGKEEDYDLEQDLPDPTEGDEEK